MADLRLEALQGSWRWAARKQLPMPAALSGDRFGPVAADKGSDAVGQVKSTPGERARRQQLAMEGDAELQALADAPRLLQEQPGLAGRAEIGDRGREEGDTNSPS
jgi:hypothetical protein